MSTTSVVDSVNVDGNDKKLKFGEKVAVVIPGTLGTFHSQVIQMFLLFFYTDMMGISAAYAAGLFLFIRIFDAIAAPAFGIFIDKMETPWGKYKPWFIGVAIFAAVFGWLTFTDFGLSGNAKLIYATITYFLYSTFKTLEIAPQMAIVPVVTKRIDDRMSMNQISYFLMMIAAMVASVAVQPLYKILGGGNGAKGFSIIMGTVAIITILIGLFQAFKIKERYTVQSKKDEKSFSLKEMLSALLSNKTALIVYGYILGINLSNGFKSTLSIYYYKYYFHNEGLVAIIGLVSMVPTLIGVAFSGPVTKRIGIKNNLVMGSIISVVTTFALIAVPPTKVGLITFIVLYVVAGLFTGISTPAAGTMMPAAMDYTEWKTGKNINGFMGSLQGFLQTFSTAISGSIAAIALSVIGYVSGAAQQSSSTITGIKILMSIVPAIIMLLTLVVIKFDLTEDKQAQITKELAERRKIAEANVEI
ncbi:putative glucitol transport protein GutA [Clostridium zeae]|uniref:Glucitol transport protein GutA n=1 Tax=Clostridium zeae TaxID=2759022 RepID=A0ABQ1EEC8_9CLOT|nr:glycoside-pentoside-hexuronide (GPH):cation symporter [Clostridium zeae]GFZ33125.1 putative glucitol transport protein GutA [Clostridium zeae]